jgi:hypothetical protein
MFLRSARGDTTTLSQNCPKSRLLKRFYYFVQSLIRALYDLFAKRKSMHLRTLQGRKSQKLGPQIANPQLIQVCKFAGFRFADRPPLEIII